MPVKNLVGKKFGKLTVIGPSESRTNDGHAMWRCLCDCGNERLVSSQYLVSGKTKSCGCLMLQILKEGRNKNSKNTGRNRGESKTRLYHIWKNAKSRCENENDPGFKNYGARGITFYEPWGADFLIFKNWAYKNGYDDKLEIDRIDNDGGYSPQNCRWVTRTQNANNKRNSHFLLYNGITHSIAEWSRIVGIPEATIRSRLDKGLSIEKVLKRKDNK